MAVSPKPEISSFKGSPFSIPHPRMHMVKWKKFKLVERRLDSPTAAEPAIFHHIRAHTPTLSDFDLTHPLLSNDHFSSPQNSHIPTIVQVYDVMG
ncbi:hypothetical protein CCACVL1_04288 [Corchorus capsularis]|uniref:Uncharacterized protein n=1 Tax=Corchorus capsularis TaxID=210143 RepID=A0A1R3JTZ9_COCAP|nr:hypothetical protein CCACVL1_04288 [Corchorus capsularis]